MTDFDVISKVLIKSVILSIAPKFSVGAKLPVLSFLIFDCNYFAFHFIYLLFRFNAYTRLCTVCKVESKKPLADTLIGETHKGIKKTVNSLYVIKSLRSERCKFSSSPCVGVENWIRIKKRT